MDQEHKQKYMQLQAMHQHIEQMQENMKTLEKQVAELVYVEQSLDEMQGVQEGTEILVQLASGIFARAELKEPQTLRVNVGANVVVEKTVNQTRKLLTSQVEDLQKVQLDLQGQFTQVLTGFQQLQQELKTLK
jgi:prefoldin alpha subunit